jgi:hypothetical protein
MRALRLIDRDTSRLAKRILAGFVARDALRTHTFPTNNINRTEAPLSNADGTASVKAGFDLTGSRWFDPSMLLLHIPLYVTVLDLGP